MSTCMYSQIQYDRDGNAVGGGRNHNTENISCSVCGKNWIGHYTDLEKAQAKPIEWSLIIKTSPTGI